MLEYNLKQTLIKFWNKAKQTFALKTELAQPDWNQNNPDAPDHIKNRTHWEDENTTTLESRSIDESNYDSQMEMQGSQYNVYDDIILTPERIIGTTITVNGVDFQFTEENRLNAGDSILGSGDTITWWFTPDPYGISPNAQLFSAVIISNNKMTSIIWCSDDYTIGDTLISANKIFITSFASQYSWDIPSYTITETVYHKLNKEYIDTDWDENDEESVSHIKNRTHWKEHIITDARELNLENYDEWDEENGIALYKNIELTENILLGTTITYHYMEEGEPVEETYILTNENRIRTSDDASTGVWFFGTLYDFAVLMGQAGMVEQMGIVDLYKSTHFFKDKWENFWCDDIGVVSAMYGELVGTLKDSKTFAQFYEDSNNYFERTLNATNEYIYYKINKNYLPLDAQSDWDQNDDTQINYVKNRTHYKYIENIEVTLGDTIYDSNQSDYFTNINPDITTADGLQITVDDGYYTETYKYEDGRFHYISIRRGQIRSEEYYDIFNGENGNILVGENDYVYFRIVTTPDETYTTTGLYVMNREWDPGEEPMYPDYSISVEKYKTIDPKFLPELISTPDWNQNNSEASDYIRNRTHWKEIVGTDYSSDMDFTQLYYGVNADDGGKMDHFDYGYARFDVVNQDPEVFIDRSFHRDSTGDPLEGKIEWYDEVETGWFEMYGDGHLIAVLVTDDYNPQSVQFHTVGEDGFPVDFTTTPGLYVVNAINGSVEDGEILGLFDFFIDHETIYHTIGKEYLPPVEWDEILNKTHGIEETTGETIVVEASVFTDDDEFCTATFADSYTTCYRKFGLIYEDGWVDEWYGSLKLLKAGETEFIDCSDGIPMFEAGDLLLFGNPHLYDGTFEDNGEPYVAYELVSNQDNHWNIKIDSEFAWLEGLTEMDIQDIANIKKLDKVYLPSDTVYQQDLAPVAASNDYNDLDNKPTIPVQPTKTSDLVNDGEGDSPLNPYIKSSDLVAGQSDLDYIMGN